MGVCESFVIVSFTQNHERLCGGIFSLKTTAAVLWPETTRPGRRFLLVWFARWASQTSPAGGSQFSNTFGFCEGNPFENTPEFIF